MQTRSGKLPVSGRALVIWLCLISVGLLAGCASPSLDDYRGMTPELVPERFFQGELVARGVVRNHAGEVIRTLDVTMDDWMHLITPDTLINQTEMKKWGFTVGEVVLVIQRLPLMTDLPAGSRETQ